MNTSFADRLKPRNLRRDLYGGITTAVVSLPLAIAFGAASGAGAAAGLYGAIILGFFAAFFGGTKTLISEPTGPMTVLMAAVIVRMGNAAGEYGLALAFTAVIVAGIVQILFGVLKLGKYFTMMPYSVISGFMSGIGILLIINQLPGLLGSVESASSAFALPGLLIDTLSEPRWSEIILGGGSLFILFSVPRRIQRVIPVQLLALVAGSLAAAFLLPEGSFRSVGEVSLSLPRIIRPRIPLDLLSQVLVDGAILGVLGSIDTLLTAMIADSLTREPHDSNRELMGQGIGNILSGLFGGLPGAGATMGTVVNIQTGARSPVAGMIRAGVLIALVSVFAPLLQFIPMAVLAAIAVKVGFNILDWSFLGRAHQISRAATFIMYAVLLLTVFVDLLVAVGVGVFIANVLTIERLSAQPATRVRSIDPSGDPVVVNDEEKQLLENLGDSVVLFHLSGPMIFGVAQAIARESNLMRESASSLILDLTEVSFLSTTVSLSLETIILDAAGRSQRVIIAGASEAARAKLEKLEISESAAEYRESRLEALKALSGAGVEAVPGQDA
jgi:SulP family sulfate permease